MLGLSSSVSRPGVGALILLLLCSGVASAQNRPRIRRVPSKQRPLVTLDKASSATSGKPQVLDACTQGNVLLDGGFEETDPITFENPNFTTDSTQVGNPICSTDACGNVSSGAAARSGSFWAWFGGISGDTPEVSYVEQQIVFPTNATSVTLNYYLWIGFVELPHTDTLSVKVDGATLQTWVEPAVAEAGYTMRSLNLTAFADGAVHTIKFLYTKDFEGGSANFNVDDISLDVICANVSGGTDTPGVYSPSTGTFFLRNSNDSGVADISASYGAPNATPLHGDWNGDGTDTIGIYDPPTGAFFLKNDNTPGNADIVLQFGPGGSNFVPLSGDWNGDGVDTIGIYDTNTGNFFLRNSNDGGVADIVVTFGAGGAGVYPVVGDWDNNGTDTVGIYNQNTGTFFLKLTNTPGNADLTFTFGAPAAGLLPVAGDWNNDGTDSVGVYNPATGTFFLKNANASGDADFAFSYGPAGLVPLAGDWDGL